MNLKSQPIWFSLNAAALPICHGMVNEAHRLRVAVTEMTCGAHLIDCGINVLGGIEAGLRLARLCLAGQAAVEVAPGDRDTWKGAWIQVTSDTPSLACMSAQYAGWPVQQGKFFAMGSGPGRTKRGKEALIESLSVTDDSDCAIVVLECDKLPNDEVCQMIAAETNVRCENLWLAVAPTRSLAGNIQVVARSIETSLHKCHELGLPLDCVVSAYGIAPLPPPAIDFAIGIGRTNDAILYGGHVSLWLDIDDSRVEAIGPSIPSNASRDYGRPFAETFAAYEYDFYKVDPGLFSPAEVVLNNLRTGTSWRFGRMRPDLLAQSFGTIVSEDIAGEGVEM